MRFPQGAGAGGGGGEFVSGLDSVAVLAEQPIPGLALGGAAQPISALQSLGSPLAVTGLGIEAGDVFTVNGLALCSATAIATGASNKLHHGLAFDGSAARNPSTGYPDAATAASPWSFNAAAAGAVWRATVHPLTGFNQAALGAIGVNDFSGGAVVGAIYVHPFYAMSAIDTIEWKWLRDSDRASAGSVKYARLQVVRL